MVSSDEEFQRFLERTCTNVHDRGPPSTGTQSFNLLSYYYFFILDASVYQDAQELNKNSQGKPAVSICGA